MENRTGSGEAESEGEEGKLWFAGGFQNLDSSRVQVASGMNSKAEWQDVEGTEPLKVWRVRGPSPAGAFTKHNSGQTK